MNLNQKVDLARKGKRCCICLERNSVVLCRKCVSENKLAGFCVKHMQIHNTQRTHQADFKKLVRTKTIKKMLYEEGLIQ